MSQEPRYTAKEIRERRKEIDALRRRAVASWRKDRVGAASIVIMPFEEYFEMRTKANQWDQRQQAMRLCTATLRMGDKTVTICGRPAGHAGEHQSSNSQIQWQESTT